MRGNGCGGRAGLFTDIRRETRELIRVDLGEQRLIEIRAEGGAIDEDQAVAYALEIMDRSRNLAAERRHVLNINNTTELDVFRALGRC